jgi:hypothetical protein
MDRTQVPHRTTDVACALGGAELGPRIAEWRRLRSSAVSVERTGTGARLWLGSAERDHAARLVHEEADCCGFLDFDLVAESGLVRLDVTSPVAEGRAVARVLAGLEALPTAPPGTETAPDH